ncbi:MAG TPA: flavodoxin-dependent (E)-4-hydroxy-3-methylbut-2-enyl-diphosphate synthase [Candidatus Omnitrophica bacterium]|nr:flavodoxin-dependent (E)-4-hydroxy-3-methylbut-2-enyl-diphosphate synthase [Candidatus Omnitrophota bacterium]
MKRVRKKIIKIGNVKIGGNNPIAIQSMVKADTRNVNAVIRQVKNLKSSGCDIVRIAVKDKESAQAIACIKRKTDIPIVADIHFSYELALLSIKNGADKIRLNPGNIYKKDEVRQVALAAACAGIPIRVGLNSGSVGGVRNNRKRKNPRNCKTNNLMTTAALSYIKMLEGFGFYNIVVSLKASNILDTIYAYKEFSKKSNYPLHLGITATGFPRAGIIKSAIGIGALLLDGIGDTLRVSLTDDPCEEIIAAKDILCALNLRNFGPEIISCPTCGRCEVDLVNIVKDLEKKLLNSEARRYNKSSRVLSKPTKVAVMGCVVNGPGEAKDADLGIAFGKKSGLLFKKGKAFKKIKESQATKVILKELNALIS